MRLPLTTAAVLAAMVAAFTAGCAGRGGGAVGSPGGGTTAAPGDGISDTALTAWQDFPVDRHPRPIVLTGPRVRLAGYTSGDAKIAAMGGVYRLATALPPDPPPAAVALPDGPATLPVLPAAAALRTLSTQWGPAKETAPPLAITAVEYGTASFDTDRGPLTLPAWRVHTDDELGPTVILAVTDPALWKPGTAGDPPVPVGPFSLGGAVLTGTGRTLTVSLPEAVPTCPGQVIYHHRAVVRESATAVAIGTTAEPAGTVPGKPGPCPADLKVTVVPYTVTLAAPLGDRVLVDHAGHAMPVTGGAAATATATR
jgi:hypothetical protein